MKSLSGRGPRVYSDDFKRKICNCPIHQGKLIPIENFWTFKQGKRKGLPLSRCIDGERLSNGRDPHTSGLVPYYRVRFIFDELEFRIGRFETTRRAGLTTSFWWRHKDEYSCLKKATVIKAITVLREVRLNDEARHRNSIRHGAAARGREEKLPTRNADFNGPDNTEAARGRQRRQLARGG